MSIERIEKQKKSLLDLYTKFFEGLKKISYKGNIVMCFPYWEMNGKTIFFNEIYEILNKYCDIQYLLPKGYLISGTQNFSLLYKREKQLVGREIFKLKMK